MGHRRDDIHRGTRCVTSDGYLILYRCSPEFISIDRIVHHSRQLDHLFTDEQP
jgi:plasmid stabilization system protein ParE